MYDLIIVGAGPAGLSAAVYAKRAMLSVLLVEKNGYGGGQIVNTEKVDNYLGLPGVSGFELALKFQEHVKQLGVEMRTADVMHVQRDGTCWKVLFANGEAEQTKTILVATGSSYRKLGIPGERELAGRGVSYCATCDGAFYKDKAVAVIGGGDVAVGDALYLSNMCEKVYLIHRRDTLRAAEVMQEKLFAAENITFLPFCEAKEIIGDQVVHALCIQNNKTDQTQEIAVSGVFVAIGMSPQTAFVEGLVDMEESGHIRAGEDCVTSAPGIFVAGDSRTKQVRQLVTAVADGACAMRSIDAYLRTLQA